MKYLLLLGLLFSFTVEANSLVQRQDAFDVCAQKVAKKFFKSYESQGDAGKTRFEKDLCAFHSIPQEACLQSIMMTAQAGRLPGAINAFIYNVAIVPKCGEFPQK